MKYLSKLLHQYTKYECGVCDSPEAQLINVKPVKMAKRERVVNVSHLNPSTLKPVSLELGRKRELIQNAVPILRLSECTFRGS